MAADSLLTAAFPALFVLAAAVVLPLLSRRVGHALGVLVTGVVVPWSVLAPAGAHLPVQLFGFDAYLFNVDPFSRLMGIIFGFIGAVAILYSYASEAETIQTAFAMSYVGSSLGAVFAGDWLSMLFFWELMAVTSTLLVWHYGGIAVRAGFRYALLHGIGGSLLMAAIIWHYVEVGTFLFASVPGGPAVAGIAAGVPQLLAALGIGVNVGFIGLHAWLPDTYPRPHVAASVFLCVYTTKTGVYGMYRAFPEGQLAIAYMGGAMAVFGAGMALLQNDMRRLLSYHIQSQVGYMVAGVGIPKALATAGAFGHVFNHILYKSLLFMTVGVVIYRTGEESLKKLGGLAREMPITAITFTIAALSIAGFPGFNGFVSKGMVIGAAHKKHLDVLWYLLLAGGVGTFLSFIKLGYHAFLHGEYEGTVADANRGQSVAMISVAALCVVYGLVPDLLFDIVPLSGEFKFHVFTLGHIAEGLVLALLGVVGFAILQKPLKKVGRVPDVDALYNRVVFYGTRGLVVGVTETYAAVDRGVVGTVKSVERVGANPRSYAKQVGLSEDIRAGIGRGVMIVTVVTALALLVLLNA